MGNPISDTIRKSLQASFFFAANDFCLFLTTKAKNKSVEMLNQYRDSRWVRQCLTQRAKQWENSQAQREGVNAVGTNFSIMNSLDPECFSVSILPPCLGTIVPQSIARDGFLCCFDDDIKASEIIKEKISINHKSNIS